MRGRKTNKRIQKRSLLLNATLLVFLILPLSVWSWWSYNLKPVSDNPTVKSFLIKPGMNAAQVASELEDQHLIRNADVFRLLSRMEGTDNKLAAGIYQIASSMSAREILQALLLGSNPENVKVTIPEGFSTKEIISTLAQAGLGQEGDYWKAIKELDIKKYAFLKGIPIGEQQLEGFLFPDTYFFDSNDQPEEIIARFLDRFEKEIDTQTEARLKERNLSVYDWVIKASIVEREAVKAEERAVIAGIFENRLRIGMALQSCATVQYIIGERKPILSLEDIAIDSPYNTYKNPGLPPGPISNPGHASLQAALNPTKTNYMYFVAKNDGGHAFARSYEEHLRNVNQYQ